MSKDEITGYAIAGLSALGFSIWFLVVAYEQYYCCSACSLSDVAVFLFMSLFLAAGAIWGFTLPYCYSFRLIDEITYANGKLRFSCRGKSFEDSDRIFLKFNLYSIKSQEIPAHIFIWIKSGPWLCPFTLWEDCVKAVGNEAVK